MVHLTPLRFALAIAVIAIGYAALSLARGRPFLIGDCPYYAATTHTLLHDGDWDLRNQLPGDVPDHHGFFALSIDGRIVPKHSVLMPIVSIPFYFIFGTLGFLIVNLITTFALVWGIMRLAGGDLAARWLALVAYLSTPFLAYTVNYSPDVFATSLFIWSCVFAVRNRPLACGVCAGLAVWAKITMVLLLLPLALIIVPPGWRATLKCGLAAAVAVSPMLIIQTHLFGSPFVTGYDRDARLTEAGFIITEHYSRFNVPLLTGLGNLLFDPTIGMLKTAPLWFLWPVGVVMAIRSRSASEAFASRLHVVALLLSLLANLVFFACYDEWNASMFGNRFLFPALALGFVLQNPLWRWLMTRIVESRGQRVYNSATDEKTPGN